jgi:hypothetical protein
VTADLTKDEKKYDGSVSLTTPLGKASRARSRRRSPASTSVPKMKWSAGDRFPRRVVPERRAGLRHAQGMAPEIFDPQPALIDPETGRNLGAPDKLVGEVVIEKVDAQYSTARVVSGAEFKRNQVVRLKGQGAQGPAPARSAPPVLHQRR